MTDEKTERRRIAAAKMRARSPAFPIPMKDQHQRVPAGLTTLEWFAGQALAGRIPVPLPVVKVDPKGPPPDGTEKPNADEDAVLAARMFSIAEAMVAEAQRRREGG